MFTSERCRRTFSAERSGYVPRHFGYIEHVFTKIKPQKLFFLAVDGVAPRAKMNQQRSRRFRTAKEAKDVREKALRRGEELPEEDALRLKLHHARTPFMTRLSAQLKYFSRSQGTDDAAWRGLRSFCQDTRSLARASTRYGIYPTSQGAAGVQPKRSTLPLRTGCRSHHAGIVEPRSAFCLAS
ncbi:hypothetical protein L7F22_015032 [Adiantum nelumboides]|nr:hypothetical protein [Adiantum nelumboides]